MAELFLNINTLISELKRLGEKSLLEDRVLYDETREVFRKLNLLSDFDERNIQKIIQKLESLPPEIREKDLEELEDGKDKQLESNLNQKSLEELLEDYKKSQDSKEKERISHEVYLRTGEKDVARFIARQKELAAEQDLSAKEREEIIKMQVKQEEGVKTEKINKEIEHEIYTEKSDLKKELKKKYGKNNDKTQEILKKIDQIKAEIKVENEANKIVEKVFTQFKEESLPINENSQEELKRAILNSWETNEKLTLPKDIAELADKTTATRELKVAVDKFKENELSTVTAFRANKLESQIARSLRESGVKDEGLITEYVNILNEFYNNPESLIEESNTDEYTSFVKSTLPQSSGWQVEESVREARFLANNIVKSPKKFNSLINRYNSIRDKIGIEKLPKIEQARITEKITNILSKSPQTLKALNQIQTMGRVVTKLQNFPRTVFIKGVEKVSVFVFKKVGNQAMVSFIQNSAAVIAKEGTVKGMSVVLKSILSKGAVTAGTTAAGAAAGGAAAGGAAAGSAAAGGGGAAAGAAGGPIGLLILAIVGIIKLGKKLLEKILGKKLDQVQKFLAEDLGLGNFVGKVGQFIFDIGVFLIAIPALLRLQKSTALAPVIGMFFFIFFIYTTLQQQQISSIVPPTDLSGCILKRGSGPGGLPSNGKINCDPNAPENEVPGLRGGKENYIRIANEWWSGKSHAEECFNDVVNRSLCAGINPLYSLWAWAHESAASNYDHGNIQDFGINDSSIENNFDAQIKVFLNLDPASACDLSDPKLSGPDGYWLAWASRYLTGQCDPDVGQKQTGETGRDYYEDMKNKTWNWIASVPMPADIYVEKGGKKCEQAGAPFALTGPTKEIIGDDGQVYICSTSGGKGGPSMISPGGAPVAGYITQCPFESFTHSNSWAIDWGAPFGTPIYSTFSGIARLGEGNGYGFYIDVHSNYNGDDFFIRYAHMPPGGYTVSDGEAVAAGQQIGIVDNTGFSTGNHLHYQIFGANIDWDNAGPYFGMTQEEFNSACR